MWQLSKHLGLGVEAWFTDASVDFFLPDEDPIFGKQQGPLLINLGIATKDIVTIRQVHGRHICVIDQDFLVNDSVDIPEADGVMTQMKDVVLTVRTADCLPVFLFDPIQRCIALLHVGWKSAREEILCLAIDKMKERFQSDPSDIKAAFGPSIHNCCYQVGQDLANIFPEQIMPKNGEWFLDLQAVALIQLESKGVSLDFAYDSGMCTCCNKKFFSYRRQGRKAGRHLSVLRLRA